MTPDTNAAPISDEDRANLRALYGDCDPREDIFGTGRMVMALDARLTLAEQIQAALREQLEGWDEVANARELQLVAMRAERDAARAALVEVTAQKEAAQEIAKHKVMERAREIAELFAAQHERDQARAAEARMRDLLRRHEWAYDEECIDLWCMECRAGRNQGHKPDCALARALDDHGRGEGA